MQPNRDINPRSTGPVMDVQRPAMSGGPSPSLSQTPAPMPSPSNVITPNTGGLNRPATLEYTRPRPIDTPDMSGPSNSFAPPSPSAETPTFNPKKKRSKAPLIILLVILVLAAAGGAAYYFLVMNKTETPVVTPTTVVEPAPTNTIEATPEGVDKTVEIIDQNLNSVSDTADFTPSDVSDDALGL